MSEASNPGLAKGEFGGSRRTETPGERAVHGEGAFGVQEQVDAESQLPLQLPVLLFRMGRVTGTGQGAGGGRSSCPGW